MMTILAVLPPSYDRRGSGANGEKAQVRSQSFKAADHVAGAGIASDYRTTAIKIMPGIAGGWKPGFTQ
jgi:hypothetical protein